MNRNELKKLLRQNGAVTVTFRKGKLGFRGGSQGPMTTFFDIVQDKNKEVESFVKNLLSVNNVTADFIWEVIGSYPASSGLDPTYVTHWYILI